MNREYNTSTLYNIIKKQKYNCQTKNHPLSNIRSSEMYCMLSLKIKTSKKLIRSFWKKICTVKYFRRKQVHCTSTSFFFNSMSLQIFIQSCALIYTPIQ